MKQEHKSYDENYKKTIVKLYGSGKRKTDLTREYGNCFFSISTSCSNSNSFFSESSIGISCLIILIINTILPLGWFLCNNKKPIFRLISIYQCPKSLNRFVNGADKGNWTPTATLARLYSTIKLCPHGGPSRIWTNDQGVAVPRLTTWL